ncbi:MAG: (d)CMP kinase, partial [Bacteroidetes bacterium]|nr:(d)CMP kinase [Bacteroidota bacterium]
MKKIVIAIDGPAASGKSTTAKLTAEKLNYLHIDTGAMYRALTLKVIENNVNPEDETSVYDTVKNCVIEFDRNKNAMLVFLDGKNVTEAIRNREVTRNVSAVSS